MNNETKKLERWADKLLDTGKRNNLINFRDYKMSSAEVVYPDADSLYSKCSLGRQFVVYDPGIIVDESITEFVESQKNKGLSKEEYKELYSGKIKNEKTLLLYSQGANPISSIRRIAKKAKDQADETGINVAYLAFGFVKWHENNDTNYYKAPLLLVHINIITGSVLDPVMIEISDDDIVINPTFNFLLNAEYGIRLPKLKDDETLASYSARVHKVVRTLGWEVINECKVGIFSFLKINMYEDIKNNANKILKNKIIKTLIDGEAPDSLISIDKGESQDNPLIDLHSVVEADSSQIEAIEMAKHGNSFVLQGPPGTGKSQTITNIIAELLYDGKKVLFVSEKQAALNVVYDKLRKNGLSDFCLELHSHKANKKTVIEELNRTLELPKTNVKAVALSDIKRKKEVLQILDDYESELHKKRLPINKSLYQLFEEFSAIQDDPCFDFPIRYINRKNETYLEQALDLLGQYAALLPSFGYEYRANTWYGFIKPQIGYDERNAFLSDLESLLEGLRELKRVTEEISNRYGVSELNYFGSLLLSWNLRYLGSSKVITPALLSKERCGFARSKIVELKMLSEIIKKQYQIITDEYSEEVFQEIKGAQTHKALLHEYNKKTTRFFSKDYRKLIAKIKTLTKKPKKIKYLDAVELAKNLTNYWGYIRRFNETENAITDCLGSCYLGLDTDWQYFLSGIDELLKKQTNGWVPALGIILDMSREEFESYKPSFLEDSALIADLIYIIREPMKHISEMFNTAALDFENDSYAGSLSKLQSCVDDFDKLASWIRYNNLLAQLQHADLVEYIEMIVSERIEPNEIVPGYKRAFYKKWIDYIIEKTPVLNDFSRDKQDSSIQLFNEKDALQYEINKALIKAKLSSQRPSLDIVSEGSTVAMLRSEGQKKRKQMPIRQLLSEAGSLVQMIKPCFLMSPLSVSTFLDSSKISFDTVVFDEASQIFPQDALGAIYRGKQIIVVGDSKQMPPSNFFSSSSDTDEDDDIDSYDITDFESILDVCSSLFITQKLAWHYRSRYEQLIAFSNLYFYNNNLVTFPSATEDKQGVGVDYYGVDGVFDRQSKTNLEEARFIVDLIYENIKNHPNRSLGVVAFSVSQQNLIDKLLLQKRMDAPECEWFFSDDNPEPFFIKNLETVQGDERDTIIFSIAYAHDSNGRFIHNFGPLNREGGERRLNVAITRARDNVQLVSSIHYTDINLNNTNSEGVRLLRSYLEYAQNGDSVIVRENTSERRSTSNTNLEEEICSLIKSKGLTVDRYIGCSEDRIDMGIRREANSNYLIAIECDGQVYHNSKNARDRDCLRKRILENMGWHYYRVWSVEWYKDNPHEQARLFQFIWDAFNAGNDGQSINKTNKEAQSPDNSIPKANYIIKESSNNTFEEYSQLDALSIVKKNYSFKSAILELLNWEEPLSEEFLLKRIVDMFDRTKVTNFVIKRFDALMYSCESNGIIRKDGFLYYSNESENMLKIPNSKAVLYKLRIPGDVREVKYIALEELAGGMYMIIKQNDSVTKEGLFKLLTNILGFSRTGDAILERYEQALSLLIKNKLVKYAYGYLTLKI